ncbi:MFS transporter [Pseudoduganella namucuonensis]|uniref:Nucleoside transporter n=1 Tax=Pseudoduganella namucuonensis TaxID=1035707 RepID=A0A1I7LZM0_9BURK|nr:MFS transporter [Pseudoduganella namucuonensis]SFV15057.1 nucleoside transporter [Pseudoduganella namucuonensis]
MKTQLRVRLSAMMFGQYFVQGAWFVTLGTYLSQGLKFDHIIGVSYSMMGIAAIVSTLLVGSLADRYFAAQKVMAALSLVAGASMLWLSTIHDSPTLFLAVLLLHCLAYVPTVPLANAIAFNAMSDSAREFPAVRVFGTLGWIGGGLAVGAIPGAAQTPLPMQIAALAGVLLGLYALTLPDTPARERGAAGGSTRLAALFGLDIVAGMRDRPFWVFIASSLLIVIPLSFYYAYCNTFLVEIGARVALFGHTFEPVALQTLGQVSEMGFILLLPVLLARMGIKWVILAGMAAWCLRYVLFAYSFDEHGPVMPLALLGIVLHGVCYDFFFVAGQIYVDGKFPPRARVRAQSFLALVTAGVGVLIGSNVAGLVYGWNTLTPALHDWRVIWLVPAGIAVVVMLMFAAAFRAPRAAPAGGAPLAYGAAE